jgi:hypothetical protein
MHAVMRTYSGPQAKQLFDLLHERKADVEATLRKVPGLVSYTMVRTADGGKRRFNWRERPHSLGRRCHSPNHWLAEHPLCPTNQQIQLAARWAAVSCGAVRVNQRRRVRVLERGVRERQIR